MYGIHTFIVRWQRRREPGGRLNNNNSNNARMLYELAKLPY